MIDRSHFVLVNPMGLVPGDRVVAVSRWKANSIVGEITLIWLGQAETVEVRDDDGRSYSFFPELGDQIAVLP